MAEWVRALDWRPVGPVFESRFGTLAIPFILLCQCLSEETLKAVGPFYRCLSGVSAVYLYFSDFVDSCG